MPAALATAEGHRQPFASSFEAGHGSDRKAQLQSGAAVQPLALSADGQQLLHVAKQDGQNQ